VKTTPATTDEYLTALPHDQKEALEKLRTTIIAAAPGAKEYIGSGVPAFEHGGKYLVSFGAAKQHVALYVMRGSALEALAGDLEAYDTSKKVIRFAPNKPLPASLVKKIVEVRLSEIEAKTPPAIGDTAHEMSIRPRPTEGDVQSPGFVRRPRTSRRPPPGR
jgi:uncharacterized protein YdhG (YjbR/CyaY superfamily)